MTIDCYGARTVLEHRRTYCHQSSVGNSYNRDDTDDQGCQQSIVYEEQMLQHKCEHRCCNTNANTDVQHKCENSTETQNAKDVKLSLMTIDCYGSTHKMLEHKSEKIADAATQKLKHDKYCNTND
jgi:hypothetical protein